MIKVIINGYTGETDVVEFEKAVGAAHTQELLFGVFTVVFSLLSIIMYILVLFSIISEKDFSKNVSQQIMFHIGICNCVQLVIHLSSGVYIFLQVERFDLFEKIQGALMNGMWCAGLVLTAFLAINRFIMIVFFTRSNRIFTKQTTMVCFIFCWACFAVVFVMNIAGLSMFVYVLPYYTWQYIAGYPLGGVLREVSNTLILVVVLISAVSYIIIFGYVFTHNPPSKKEILLTVQVFAMSVYDVLGYCIWTYVPVLDGRLAIFASNFIWVLWNAINPYIMLVLNRRVRERVIALVCRGIFTILGHNVSYVSGAMSVVTIVRPAMEMRGRGISKATNNRSLP